MERAPSTKRGVQLRNAIDSIIGQVTRNGTCDPPIKRQKKPHIVDDSRGRLTWKLYFQAETNSKLALALAVGSPTASKIFTSDKPGVNCQPAVNRMEHARDAWVLRLLSVQS